MHTSTPSKRNALNLYEEALARFRDLLDEAGKTDIPEPAVMLLATADARGRPSVRAMLLKGVDKRGFVFFTNQGSRKGRELKENPHASLCFFWQPLMEQVRIDGQVEPVSEAESDHYWETRPRENQLGAWASAQSEPLDSRETLERKLEEYRESYRDQPIPRPPHWSGIRVIPERIEFWKSGGNRLHHRECYEKTSEGWKKTLLNP
jgi:pyridoxamine 5'-phosphate oxidase